MAPYPMGELKKGPKWWNRHQGIMLNVRELSDGKLVIAPILPSEARVEITRQSDAGGGRWLVSWERIVHNPYRKVTGSAIFTDEDLTGAFKLSLGSSGGSSDKLRRRFKADFAEEGKYIRRGDFLNIPGPGTGEDNDPNVSILLGTQIVGAVLDLINGND
ncbi:MAG: hypothetical protein AAB587_01510 [Patescibacteria group bacterium]